MLLMSLPLDDCPTYGWDVYLMEPLRSPCIYALDFDRKLEHYLRQQVDKLLTEVPFGFGKYVDKYRTELYFLSQLLLHSSTSLNGPSPGQALFGLNFKNCQRWKRIFRFIITIILPYCFNKLAEKKSKAFFGKFSSFIALIGLLHHLYFLRYGGYCTLPDQILRLRIIQAEGSGIFRNRNTNFINKELLWHVFRELMFILIPIYMQLTNPLRQNTALGDDNDNRIVKDDIIYCRLCQRPAILPIRDTSYGHACYYCHYVTEQYK